MLQVRVFSKILTICCQIKRILDARSHLLVVDIVDPDLAGSASDLYFQPEPPASILS
jgi:hypothetical protein